MESQMWTLWREELSMMLPDTTLVDDGENEGLEGTHTDFDFDC